MAEQPDVPPILVTQHEAAVALGVHLNTVKRLVSAGELPVRRLGHLTRIRYEDLVEFARALPSA